MFPRGNQVFLSMLLQIALSSEIGHLTGVSHSELDRPLQTNCIFEISFHDAKNKCIALQQNFSI